MTPHRVTLQKNTAQKQVKQCNKAEDCLILDLFQINKYLVEKVKYMENSACSLKTRRKNLGKG